MSRKSNPAPAGSNYKETTAVDHIARHPELSHGTERNLGLTHDGFFTTDDGYDEVPEYTEEIRTGGRTKIKVGPATKPNASAPRGARPDSSPDWSAARSTSGGVHPKGKPETARPGAAPRHSSSKPVTSTPEGGGRTPAGKDSTNPNDSTAYGRGYGNRESVKDGPTVRKRSDVVK